MKIQNVEKQASELGSEKKALESDKTSLETEKVRIINNK